jgi:hypothetical protein
MQGYSLARQWGWMSVNDIRRLENLNAIGPDGDVYLQPLNMVPAGSPLPRVDERPADAPSPDSDGDPADETDAPEEDSR